MRKPNYVQIKLDAGRVREEFFIPYGVFEDSLLEITDICTSVMKSKRFSFETKVFFRELLLHATGIEQRINYLLEF